MKKSLLLAAMVAFAAVSAQGAEYWVSGVTKESGWHDANKIPSYENGDDGYYWVSGNQGDERICHAAAAANLIAWWQDQYKGYNLPAGVPSDANTIWETYKANQVADAAGSVAYSFQWWITGVNIAKNDEEAKRTCDGNVSSMSNCFNSFDGYYYDFIAPYASGTIDGYGADTGISEQLKAFFDTTDVTDFAHATATMLQAIEDGKGVALRMYFEASHALTLWGMETNVTVDATESISSYTGEVHKLWLTDSDDSKEQYGGISVPSLFYVYVAENDEGKMEILDHGGKNTNAASDRGLDGFVITGVTAIDSSVSDKWFKSVAPEPSTATLSLLALASLSMRRRRK